MFQKARWLNYHGWCLLNFNNISGNSPFNKVSQQVGLREKRYKTRWQIQVVTQQIELICSNICVIHINKQMPLKLDHVYFNNTQHKRASIVFQSLIGVL